MENKPTGLFDWIRKTSFLSFFLDWIASIVLFGIVYWIISIFTKTLLLASEPITFSFAGLFKALYASFLSATLFGIVKLNFSNFVFLIYIQAVFTILILLVLIDKILQKWAFPYHHATHAQDKKFHTILLMLSIFREDVTKIKSEFRSNTKKDINIKEIEAIIDGLYVAFLDIEKLFSVKNPHRHKIKNIQYLMMTVNVEDSLETLSGFIDFLDKHKIEWKDKSVEFWLTYILETADKIVLSIDTDHIQNPKVIIAVENIKECIEKLENKL